ncbi:hypothetical protein [Natronolimnohabitans innermongolicus]|uniref:Uncharacterized protein n=1 Tax=Natronolimnohabitans innermongolicus JCM 12255 TaxID=1227499 RepID=L9XCW3_9EURY|nr:hypothetical protein [Natronolimnohabitans innermongolicus]ELY59575.1 hypothetical protein C493_05105 [Natronolimnohabitans innermongolicus JCM 12255]
MTNRFGVAITAVAVALLLVSSVGVSTVALDRAVTIDVVDDDEAAVGFETVDTDAGGEELNVTNRMSQPLELERPATATPNAGNGSVSVSGDDDGTIDSGETVTLSVEDVCDGGDDVAIDIELIGDGVSVERTEALACPG